MIQFKKVILHNFGSYGHAELELQNRGFCLVSGKNNYIKDNALSNGSGKSFLWSAICYALTGETISGIKTNLKNINTEDSDCYVQLDFLYDRDLFSITRVSTPKTELKIFKNDVDLSGKGIRESEKKLQEVLPDLTKDLISSTIIIGQGMPHKFSSFSPSGRKELLEKLTKSDFMIEDLKTRIQARQQELSKKVRELEDSLIADKTKLNNYLANLDKIKTNLDGIDNYNFDQLILKQQDEINKLQQDLNQKETFIKDTEQQIETLNNSLLIVMEDKNKISAEELAAYTSSHTSIAAEKSKLEFTISNLKTEINKLKSITDICPTCGQKLPDIHKPDTTSQEAALADYLAKYNKITDELVTCEKKHQEYLNQINEAFAEELKNLNTNLTSLKQQLEAIKKESSYLIASLETEKTIHNKLIYDKQHWEEYKKNQQQEVECLEKEIAQLTNLIAIVSLSKEDFNSRLAIIKKMDSLVKRDFRGYLLANIIKYLDSRVKDYCSIVFGTKDLSLQLNGNALDITYCGKLFDGLSGGEKQRVDLIIQLAIRDLLTNYLSINANILVLDEITDFLDKKSCKAVMELLEKELHTVESVFIISHHAEELEIPVDSEIKIVKNENGISEIY